MAANERGYQKPGPRLGFLATKQPSPEALPISFSSVLRQFPRALVPVWRAAQSLGSKGAELAAEFLVTHNWPTLSCLVALFCTVPCISPP